MDRGVHLSLIRRGKIWHYDFIIDGVRHRGSTKCERKAEARSFEDDLRRRALVVDISQAKFTISQVADRWFAARQADKKSAATTAIRIEIMLRLIGPNTLVSHIDAPDIEEAMQQRRAESTRQGKTPSNSTVNRDLIDTTLRPMLNYARRVLKQPVHEIEWRELRLSEPKGRDRTFTGSEIAAWRAALPTWHRAVFDFASRYGVRLREAFFALECVDAEAGRILLRDRKNGRGHNIRLLPDDRTTIAALYTRARAARLRTLWFREMATGQLRPIHWRGFQAASKAALVRAGITNARPVHDLRHHAASTLVRRTGNLAATKALLGHDNIQSTMRYVHADDDDVFQAMLSTYCAKSPTIEEDDANIPSSVRS
jgi:integrase